MLEVTSTLLDEFSTEQSLEVFVANSVTVTVHDNDGRFYNLLLFKCTSLFNVNCSNKYSFPR